MTDALPKEPRTVFLVRDPIADWHPDLASYCRPATVEDITDAQVEAHQAWLDARFGWHPDAQDSRAAIAAALGIEVSHAK